MHTDMNFDMNRATAINEDEVADIFDYHVWDDAQKEKGAKVREALGKAFQMIIYNVPPCPRRTMALQGLITARMDANAAITHGKY